MDRYIAYRSGTTIYTGPYNLSKIFLTKNIQVTTVPDFSKYQHSWHVAKKEGQEATEDTAFCVIH